MTVSKSSVQAYKPSLLVNLVEMIKFIFYRSAYWSKIVSLVLFLKNY